MERNSNIDVVRCVSNYLIVLLHAWAAFLMASLATCSRGASGSILRISEGRYWGNLGRVERVDTCRAWRIEWRK